MNKAQRAPYLGLTMIRIEAPWVVRRKPRKQQVRLVEHPFFQGNMALCHFCKYALWSGTPCREDGYLDCTHPLASWRHWEPNEVWGGLGTDCWGFRPAFDIDEAADILGIYLRGEWI